MASLLYVPFKGFDLCRCLMYTAYIIIFPGHSSGDYVAFDQCEWILRNQVVRLEPIVTLVVFIVSNFL